MKIRALSAALIAVMGSVAAADGLYVSGSISALTFGHEIERNRGTAELSSLTRTEETGGSLGVALGYEAAINSSLYWGAEAFYNYSDIDSKNINNGLVTEINVNGTYGVRGILGANVTEALQLYAHAGVTQVDFDVRNSYTFDVPVRTRSDDETAFSYGFGAAVKVSDRVSVFGEYTQVSEVDFDGIAEAPPPNSVNPNSLDLSSVALGVKFSF